MFTNPKRKHFEKKLAGIQAQIFDKEFQKHQAIQIREEVRLDRDRALEAVDAFETELKKEGHQPNTISELTAKRDEAKANADRFTAQMKMVDEQVEGVAYVPANAEKGTAEVIGQQGINDTISSLNEVRKMVVSYLKTC